MPFRTSQRDQNKRFVQCDLRIAENHLCDAMQFHHGLWSRAEICCGAGQDASIIASAMPRCGELTSTRKAMSTFPGLHKLDEGQITHLICARLKYSGCAKGAAKGSCGETVVQKGVFGESVSSPLP